MHLRNKLLQVGINSYKRVNRWYTFMPRQVKVEVTRVCNLHCAGCRRNFPESIANAPGPRHLTVDMLEEVIKGLPIKVVRFTGDGEPFCNPGIKDILAYLKEKNIMSAFTTNATLLDKDWIGFLEDHKVFRISVSFDGARRDTFEALRGGAKFEQVLKVCELIGKSKIQLYMNCLLSTDEVISQLPEYVVVAKDIGAIGIHIMKYQSQEESIWIPPNISRHKEVLDQLSREAKALGLLLSASYTTNPTFRECEDPYTVPWVALTGEVFPCVYMANMREFEVYQGEKIKVPWRNYVMGNTNETSLKDIWRNGPYKELRKVLRATRYPNGTTRETNVLLNMKIDAENNRFGVCEACLCRWGESGI